MEEKKEPPYIYGGNYGCIYRNAKHFNDIVFLGENYLNYKKQLKKSKWYKGSEYCKIVQINNVYSENNIKPNLKDSKYYNDFGRINQNKNSNPYSNNYEPINDNDIKTDIHSLIKENEICRQKIESIKESLL